MKRKEREKEIERLNRYKENFYRLNEIEKSFYKDNLRIKLDMVQTYGTIINSTKDIKDFVDRFDDITFMLVTLSQHEYTGFFQNTPPSQVLKTILENKHLTEILFIKRSFPESPEDRRKLEKRYRKYLSRFTEKGMEYFLSGKEYAQEEQEIYAPDEPYSPPARAVVNYDIMEGHDFECFCAGLLKKNGFSDVEVTKGSGDQGIDIIAFRDGVKYGIQCKCYSSDIGNKAVQEAFSGARFYDCHVPVVLTNRHFTRQAQELAEKTGVLLWDRDKLEEYVRTQK